MKLIKSIMPDSFREVVTRYQKNYKALYLYRNQLDGWVVTLYVNQRRPLTNYLWGLL